MAFLRSGGILNVEGGGEGANLEPIFDPDCYFVNKTWINDPKYLLWSYTATEKCTMRFAKNSYAWCDTHSTEGFITIEKNNVQIYKSKYLVQSVKEQIADIDDISLEIGDNVSIYSGWDGSHSGCEYRVYTGIGIFTGGIGMYNYSTSERKVGTWIDGSDVYEITLDLNQTLLPGETTLYHGISNLDKCISVVACCTYNNGSEWLYMPYLSPAYVSSYSVAIGNVNSSTYKINVGSLFTSVENVFVTFQYTKTAS